MEKWIGYNFESAKTTYEALKTNLGKWKVEVYLDDEYLRTVYFTFEKPKVVYTKPETVLVKGGTFQMGDTKGGGGNHTVKLTYDYWIGQYEVTFNKYGIYCEATGKSKPDNKRGGGEKPVYGISWKEAIKYCNWLSKQERLQPAYDNEGNFLNSKGQFATNITQVEGYLLPTEAEWEYAARGGHIDIIDGVESKDYKYAGSNNIEEVGNFGTNNFFERNISEVGQKAPNELGIYDMSGNIYEWCHDWYASEPNTTQTNPIGPNRGSKHVARGGSWRYPAEHCQDSKMTLNFR